MPLHKRYGRVVLVLRDDKPELPKTEHPKTTYETTYMTQEDFRDLIKSVLLEVLGELSFKSVEERLPENKTQTIKHTKFVDIEEDYKIKELKHSIDGIQAEQSKQKSSAKALNDLKELLKE